MMDVLSDKMAESQDQSERWQGYAFPETGMPKFTGLRLAALITLFFGLLLPVTAQAQLARDSEAPLDVSSDFFESIEGQDYLTWTGNVHAVQGDVVLTTPRLVLYQNEDGAVTRVEATGGVRYSTPAEKISGKKMVYMAKDDIITVTGNVVVIQGDQVMSGEKLVYNLTTGSLRFSGAGNKRVRGIFFPNSKKTPPTENIKG